MSSRPKLYTYPSNPRAFKILISAKFSGVDLEVISESPDFKLGVTNKQQDFLRRFPFGKVPALVTSDGQPLYESNAIAFYVASENDKLLPKDSYERALVLQFINMADHELYPAACTWVYPTFGIIHYNKAATEKAQSDVKRILGVLNSTLEERRFLIGDELTLADIVLVCSFLQLYQHVLDPEFRAPFENVNRWFTECTEMQEFKDVLGEVTLCTVMAEFDAEAYKKLTQREKA